MTTTPALPGMETSAEERPLTAPKQAADRADEIAIERARDALRKHGIDIGLPSEGDLDDLERDHYDGLVEACRAIASAIRSAEPQWRDIETAPKDGTRILICFVHQNAKYARDPVEEGWVAVHEACWIDHNGGGWTWHGLAGVATAWRPLPAPPEAISGKEG